MRCIWRVQFTLAVSTEILLHHRDVFLFLLLFMAEAELLDCDWIFDAHNISASSVGNVEERSTSVSHLLSKQFRVVHGCIGSGVGVHIRCGEYASVCVHYLLNSNLDVG